MQRALWVAAAAALIVTPQWLIQRSASHRLLALFASSAIIFLWSRGADRISLRTEALAPAWAPWLICFVLLAWHGPGLFGPLEFRGDEDFHFTRPLRILEALASSGPDHKPLLVIVLLSGILGIAGSATFRRAALFGFVVVIPLVLLALFIREPLEPELVSRFARYSVLGL